MRPVTPKSYAEHGRSVLERAIEGKHAVTDVPNIAGTKSDIEDGSTLKEYVGTNKYGDLVVAPGDHYSLCDVLDTIRAIQSEDE